MNSKKKQTSQYNFLKKNEFLMLAFQINYLIDGFQERMNVEREYVRQLKKLCKKLKQEKETKQRAFKNADLLINSSLETASAHEIFIKKTNHAINRFSRKQHKIGLYISKSRKKKLYFFKQKVYLISKKKVKRSKNRLYASKKTRYMNRREVNYLRNYVENIETLPEKLQFIEKSLLKRFLIEFEMYNLECAQKIIENTKKELKILEKPVKEINAYSIFNTKLKKKSKNKPKITKYKNDDLKVLYSKLKFKISILKKKISQINIFSKQNSSEKTSKIFENNLNITNLITKDNAISEKENSIDYEKKNPFIIKNNTIERGMLKTIKINNNDIPYFENKFDNIGFKKYGYQSPEKENLMVEIFRKENKENIIRPIPKTNFTEKEENIIKTQNEDVIGIQNINISKLNIETKEPAILKDYNYLNTHSMYNVSNDSQVQLRNSISGSSQTSLESNNNNYQQNSLDFFIENKPNYIVLSQSNTLFLNHTHTESTKQGLNCSIMEVVNASIKNNEPLELTIQGEVAFSYLQETVLNNPFPKLVIQINDFENFSKIMFNKSILENISNNPLRYLLNLQYLSQMIPALRYQIEIKTNKDKFLPILITSQWKHVHGESTIIITYKKNPFFHIESTLVLQDLNFIIGPENVLIKACQSKPEGTFYKKQNKLVLSLGNKTLHDDQEEKLFAKFETNGLASLNCSINVIWKISYKNTNTINNKSSITALNSFLSFDSSLNSSKDTSLNSTSYPIFVSQIIQSGVYIIF
ncbi:hypothetical protein PORY_000113 [Pneumocystis oryctolagi]|uniref:Uncharacterized protein n=1 Tax=Pneumocystis oryctolagi TaxID=42067 RepID=A0ACB7CF27_9ASCO|nr:hypothetical protein PORY_000113 [Pneumocystis oryctolagi]